MKIPGTSNVTRDQREVGWTVLLWRSLGGHGTPRVRFGIAFMTGEGITSGDPNYEMSKMRFDSQCC